MVERGIAAMLLFAPSVCLAKERKSRRVQFGNTPGVVGIRSVYQSQGSSAGKCGNAA